MVENPVLMDYRKRGLSITLAWRDTEYDENGKERKFWVKASSLKDVPEGEEVRAHIWIPVDKVVDAWLSDYRTRFGREPEWEEVARKEYRACAVGTPP
jgi:hypothetical protein